MDKVEAREIVAAEIAALRRRPYPELRRLADPANVETREVSGRSGTKYQLVIEAAWDDTARRHVRVIVAIDDGGWRALLPLADDFIIAPDGSFVGE